MGDCFTTINRNHASFIAKKVSSQHKIDQAGNLKE